MMGRGAEGAPASLAQGHKMDIYAHAIKGLALKSPFGGDESGNAGGGSGITGYSGFRVRLPNSADPKRKNRARKTPDSKKRSFGELDDGTPFKYWNHMEDYFREVNEEDIKILFPRTSFRLVDDSLAEDPCFNIPPPGRRCFDVWADEDSKLRGDESGAVSSLDKGVEQSARGLKRRLLTATAGSKKIKSLQSELTTAVFSWPDAEEEDPCSRCHVCNAADSDTWNQLLSCDLCGVAVHQECYGVQSAPEGPWLCSWCAYMRSADAQMREHGPYKCMLCPVKTGALKPVAIADSATSSKQTRFAHLFCAQWIPETFIENMSVRNVEAVTEERWRLPCSICKEKHGACIRCSEGMCGIAFHPLCAKDANLYMELRGDAENMDLRAYCKKHSCSRLETTAKDDSPRLVSDIALNAQKNAKASQSLMNGKDQHAGEAKQKLITNLKEVVERLGMSFEAVALQANIPQQTLLLWLEGKSHDDESKVNACVYSWLSSHASHRKLSGSEGGNKEKKNGFETQTDISGLRVGCFENCQVHQTEDDYNFEVDDRQNSSPVVNDSAQRDELNSSRLRTAEDANGINREKSIESASYVAPDILKKLQEIEQNGPQAGRELTGAETSPSAGVSEQWKQLQQAKNAGVMDWLPQDEVEAEICLLQNELIDCAQSNRKLSERLLSRILCRVSEERQAVRKQMHELTLVAQFLADAKEARRQGRREKRDKEAQALLAAANAAVAASPRIRREVTAQEDAYQDTTPVRAVRPPVPRAAARVSVSSSFRSQPSLPKSSPQVERVPCDVCSLDESVRSPRIVVCNRCGVAVHKECYGVSRTSGAWYCQPCLFFQRQQHSPPVKVDGNEKASPGVTCVLCPISHGAYRKSSDGRWVHVFCALWVPKSSVGRDQSAPVDLGVVAPERFELVCGICRNQHGACVTCHICHAPFHPICAREAGFLISARTVNGREHYRAFCERHSPHSRTKLEASLQTELKQYEAPDDVNALRQIRVEFERVRLICERICKRERMKRELVHCVKDVFIAQLRAAAAGQASEPASHQKPFDANGSLYSDTLLDVPWAETRIMSAGGESILPVGRGGGVFVKEVVSKRSALPEPDAVKDQRKSKKYNRHSEPLGNEKVMTPSEASMQNKLLPKGYAYVPVDVLDKGKQAEVTDAQQELQVEGKRSQ